MKKIILWVSIWLAISGGYSQDIVAKLELGSRDPKPEMYEYCPTNKGLVTLGPVSVASSRTYGLVKYDAELRREWTKEVFEQNGRRHLDLMSVVGNNIFVFVSEFFPKEKVIKTLYYKYDMEGGVLAKDEVLSVYPNQQEQKVDMQYELSPNKRKLLCYKDLRTRREAEQILYYLFDEAGDLVQNGELKFKYPDEQFSVTDLRISNDGNIFILGKYYAVSKTATVNDYSYIAFRYDLATNTMEEIKLDFNKKIITNLAFRLDKEENMYVAGFYSNIGSDRINGTIYQKISNDGEVTIRTSEEFSEEFKAKFMSPRQAEKGRELTNFYMHNDVNDNGIVLRSDGGVLLMAERFYTTYQSYRDIYGYWVQQTLYHYEDVILTSIAPDGKIEWQSIIDKSQAGTNPQALSYFHTIGEKGVSVFYDYVERKMGSNLYYNVVDMNGETSARKPLFPDNKHYRWNNEFYPNFCEQINNSEAILVFYTNNGKGLSVLKIKI